ncbi:MAG: hypothetical protein K6C34_02120 [Alphaproteobacteria bacterium]|nr:hypothetical protein [Alphaproteobacteria bacterium]
MASSAVHTAIETAGAVPIDNVHRLYLMGAMYAVMNQLGIPKTNDDAAAADKLNPLFNSINVNSRVAPLGPEAYDSGIDELRRTAARILLRIAQTLQ